MRATLLTFILLMSSVSALAAAPADDTAQRREAALRYANASDFEGMLVAGLEAGLQSLPTDQRTEIVALMRKHLRVDALKEAMVASMVTTFTTAELDALANFYSSGPGKSAMEKMKPFMATMMPMMQAEMQQTMARVQEELRARANGAPGT